MARMTKETQAKVLSHITKVAEYVNQGLSPNKAIVKVARDQDVEPGHIQLMVQAYNNARMNQQRTAGDTLHEKLAKFDVADTRAIVDELYPVGNIKTAEAQVILSTAVSDEYSYRPITVKLSPFSGLIKSASATGLLRKDVYPTNPNRLTKRAWSLLKELQQQHDERRRELSACRDKVASVFDELSLYFRGVGQPVRFKEAAANSKALFGQPAESLFKHLSYEVPGFWKQADCQILPVVDRTKAPYTLVETCIEKMAEYHRLEKVFECFHKEAAEAVEKVLSHFMPTPPRRYPGSIVKQAAEGPWDSVGGAIDKVTSTPTVSSIMGKISPIPENALTSKAFMAVNEPGHEAKMRGLKAQFNLTNMLANDEFLSGEQPEKVTNLYNQISQMAPRAAEQPLLMKALLRRYLQTGAVDPHDIDQLMGTENKMRDSRQPQGGFNLPTLPGDLTSGPKPGK